MRIGIPVVGGRCSSHFGRCEQFALVDADQQSRRIVGTAWVQAPPHEPGMLPGWLAEQGVNVVITGGMGPRAQGLLASHGIAVVLGATEVDPQDLVSRYLDGSLRSGHNICDH
jgi:predicted Fe-Mo cluster-binding NifX family protein